MASCSRVTSPKYLDKPTRCAKAYDLPNAPKRCRLPGLATLESSNGNARLTLGRLSATGCPEDLFYAAKLFGQKSVSVSRPAAVLLREALAFNGTKRSDGGSDS